MIKVTRNGYEVKIFDNMEQVENYINSILSNNNNLSPSKIYDHKQNNNHIIIYEYKIYEYKTNYKEMFMVEEL